LSSYVLIIKVNSPENVEIGALGNFKILSGFYSYVGAGGITRIKRHFKRKKRLHWHIDYLLKIAEPLEAWIGEMEEVKLVEILEGELRPYIKGFGSSDTRKFSHLFLGKPSNRLLKNLGYRKIEKF